MHETILRVEDIQKVYGNKGHLTRALDHLSFSVQRGEFLGIMGPSGSGKTTLLNCIATIDRVTSGEIFVEDQDITTLRGRKLAAAENIALALQIAGVRPREIRRRVAETAEALSITEVMEKFPYQMSGGQQQRVAAARAVVADPAIVLADEPTGALDSHSSRMLLTLLEELNHQLAATILMVTHDAFSASYCRRILFIKDGRLFHELNRGSDSRQAFFARIMDVVSVLGGERDDHA